MLDFQAAGLGAVPCRSDKGVVTPTGFYHQKVRYLVDRGFSGLLFLLLGPIAVGLILLNPFFNRGPLFFVQTRMGRNCQPFQAIKFRTMTAHAAVCRGPFDAVEQHRITTLGRILRKFRIDELPQIINVMRGEMSLIGPRPDLYDHARAYLEVIPHYRQRHNILPGISGLAQVTVGYVDGLEGLRDKVAADLAYIRHANARLDLWIVSETLRVIIGRKGV